VLEIRDRSSRVDLKGAPEHGQFIHNRSCGHLPSPPGRVLERTHYRVQVKCNSTWWNELVQPAFDGTSTYVIPSTINSPGIGIDAELTELSFHLKELRALSECRIQLGDSE